MSSRRGYIRYNERKCGMCGRGIRKTKIDGSERKANMCGTCLDWVKERRKKNDGRI